MPKVRIQVPVREQTRKALVKLAEEQDMSLAEYVRGIINKHLDK